MASAALQPRCAPANPLHDRFDSALRHYACEAARQAGLSPDRTAAQELCAAEAAEWALERLTATPAPDVQALGHKLHVVLRAAGAPRALCAAIEADVRRLVAREAQA